MNIECLAPARVGQGPKDPLGPGQAADPAPREAGADPGAPGETDAAARTWRQPMPAPPAAHKDVTSEEEQAAEEELIEVARQLAAAPAEDVVANHCYGLFELAALHLSQQPPQLEKARLAIDALGLLVDGLGDRLGQHAPALADGLSQLRLAFVRIANAAPASDGRAARSRNPELRGMARPRHREWANRSGAAEPRERLEASGYSSGRPSTSRIPAQPPSLAGATTWSARSSAAG